MDVFAELEKAAETAPYFSDHTEFRPFANPPALLALGIFDGAYFDDDKHTLYRLGAANGRLPIASRNFFVAGASQSREEWQRKGWITQEDPLGWFQWYARFWLGRRVSGLDAHQIKRHNGFKARQTGMLRYQAKGDPMGALKLRQGFLHWAAWPYGDIKEAP